LDSRKHQGSVYPGRAAGSRRNGVTRNH